jgi:FdrA protein
MILRGFIRKGEYFDSVSLMIVSQKITQLPGVIDSAVVMGTSENREILTAAGLLLQEFDGSSDTDLLIALKVEDGTLIPDILLEINQFFLDLRSGSDDAEDFNPKSLQGGLKQLPDANLSLISIPGKYAAREAMKALNQGLHVMLFSDNVSIEEELVLKKFAADNDLFVMGPDCGTAIINGVPLAFANVVNRGDIGIVAASGTGLQEVSSIISNSGAGISQAIGTGGRDVKKEIGGIMFLEGINALNKDDETKVIVLVSKPPDNEVLNKIREELTNVGKPVVAIFIGGDPELVKMSGVISAETLEQAALIAVSLSKGSRVEEIKYPEDNTKEWIRHTAESERIRKTSAQKYIRGLFSGGTLCDEAQLIFQGEIDEIYSNTPLAGNIKLENSLKSKGNTVIDLGDDEFTVGRPHPMIDFSLRNSRIEIEAADPETAVILFDLVLGYGSNPDPINEFIPAVAKGKRVAPSISFICSVTGTEEDPQNRQEVVNALEAAGTIVCSSNAKAALLSVEIIKGQGGK